MACALKDVQNMGVEAPNMYNKLASLGGNGAFHGNMHRDLVSMVDCKLPMGFQLTMPFKGRVPGHWHDVAQKILLPHELFAHMWDKERAAFHQLLLGGDGQLQRFWASMAGSPQFQEHPIHRVENFQDKAIPLSIHGDGVPITGVGKSWSKSCDIYSWTSLLGGGRIAGACLGLGRDENLTIATAFMLLLFL